MMSLLKIKNKNKNKNKIAKIINVNKINFFLVKTCDQALVVCLNYIIGFKERVS